MLLAIDSSAGASVAVIRDGEILAHRQVESTTAHTEVLAVSVRDVLAEIGVDPASAGGQLEAVVVGVGPGPFTGLRVGLAAAHGLAGAWSLPLRGICSLDSLGLRAVRSGVRGEFLAVSDARRREVYWARYAAGSGEPVLVEGPHVSAAADAPACAAVGAGVGLYPEQLRLPHGLHEEAAHWLPDAAEIALLAERPGAPYREPLPLYLRESDAKVPQQMKKAGA
ncbi:tRNA (adenosine(37)-N6)-threonylcarbamoyltransferase complex dimerization subunit type 1 TsaB [Nesterenkonia cremea]|uniref:tRNA (Adenosine(37)-N6)-threonylcarbamoyltransferase complex dimerization subunit type 1 TsaB n=1 Tax=Nesterenkonia cremea TaxID=1882340 RepID=A0A917ASI7_9MICC|nr:tRNA (adenosine(37)-N6)-threonylcarbamoyltransferase complex dimerization subunit type 1 TsaB [Nesterenkonia cremea]GGE70071.1 tRNA (adenosine(37)-N6)-threonylcarbamoyltransferase complex dimerization subunit type 1 TsaB [Nesterenkonia cremea]